MLGSPLDKLLVIAVLTSAAASIQTTILPTARTSLSMAFKGAAPRRFGNMGVVLGSTAYKLLHRSPVPLPGAGPGGAGPRRLTGATPLMRGDILGPGQASG